MTALIITFVVATFLIANVAVYSVLVRVHPRRRGIVIALIVVGNVMWIFLPILNARTDFSRFVRATLGPPWFAWTCFAILYSAFSLLLAVAWLPVMRRMTFARFARWPSRVFLWTTLFALVIGVWNALVPLRIERVPIAIDNLPKEAAGFRIALISDLHTGLYTRQSRLETIFATAAAQKPDVILLAGDNIDDDPVFTTKLLAATRVLDARMPLIAVLGNHEMYGDPFEVIRRLGGSRIHLLVNQGTSVKSVWIAGISDFASRTPRLVPDVDAALRGRPEGSFPILLAHQPKAFAEAMKRGLPLTLCGHSHGGQFAIRPLHWSLSGIFLPYHMGLYQHGPSQLYVNTGTGYWLMPWRFGIGISPEITLIELGDRRSGLSGAAPHPPPPVPSSPMRVTAGWLLLAMVILPFADAVTASRMASDCCCAAMAKGTCPLKRAAAQECQEHRAHCSMGQADSASSAQLPRSLDSRKQTTLTEAPFRELVPSMAMSFAHATSANMDSRNPSPETPPPRSA